MLSRLTRLTTMSSHVMGGLSHLWDGQTAPNVAKVSETSHRGLAHDHGFYTVQNLSSVLSSSLVSDDPFFGATNTEGRNDIWADLPERSVIRNEYSVGKEDVDLGGRFTPESGLPWYERFDPAPNFLDSCEPASQWQQTTDFLGAPDAPIENNELNSFTGSWSFGDNFAGNDSPLTTEAPWGKIDFRLDDPLPEISEEDSRSDSSSPALSQASSQPEPCVSERRMTRKKNLMDIMKETLVVPEAEMRTKTRSKSSSSSLLSSYFDADPIRTEKPKVRGIVVKPYVDAATFRRRVMNRESARKYRAKKRKEKVQVKRQLLEMEKKNVDLKVSVVGLEKEIAHMKKLLNKSGRKL